MTCFPMALKTGRTRSIVASLPPTIKIKEPASAATLEPVIGASRKSQPRSRIFRANSTLAAGEMVLESATTAPAWSDCAAPPGPNNTWSTALVSETQSQTTSLPFVASAGVMAVVAPGTSLPPLRFQTLTSCPALTRFAAMGLPIIPNPKNATRICRHLNCQKELRQVGGPHRQLAIPFPQWQCDECCRKQLPIHS